MSSDTAPALPPLDGLTVLVPEGAPTDSLSAVAYHLLRDRIVTLALEPGTAVNERELMEQLGLGRTPIREALRRLADENLVEIYPRRGMVVAPVEAGDLGAISEVRVELEGFAARLAAERATDEQRETAARLIDEVTAHQRSTDQRALIREDQRVHRHVHRCANNAFLEATLDEYLVLSLRLWFLGLHRVRRLDEAVREHQDMLAAIRDGDPPTAERVARTHVTGFEGEIRSVL